MTREQLSVGDVCVLQASRNKFCVGRLISAEGHLTIVPEGDLVSEEKARKEVEEIQLAANEARKRLREDRAIRYSQEAWMFIFAGDASIHLRNEKTKEVYAFRIAKGEYKNEYGELCDGWYVHLSHDPDGNRGYIGALNPDGPEIIETPRSKFVEGSKPHKVLSWLMKKLWDQEEMPGNYKLYSRRCGKCGKQLSDNYNTNLLYCGSGCKLPESSSDDDLNF